jgi:hypothetical protein
MPEWVEQHPRLAGALLGTVISVVGFVAYHALGGWAVLVNPILGPILESLGFD